MALKNSRLLMVGFVVVGMSIGACSGSSSADNLDKQCVGDWKPHVMTMDGETTTVEEMQKSLEEVNDSDVGISMDVDFEEMFTITMKENHEVSMSAFGVDEGDAGTWKGVEGGCEVTVGGETQMYPLEDGLLIMEVDEGNSIGLSRE